MSKVAIQGNASGTGVLTVAAPNTNSDYTLTLPAETGTVVVTDGTTLYVDNSGDKVGVGTTSPQSTIGVNVALNDTKGVVLQYNGDAKAGMLVNPISGEARFGSINSNGTYFTTFYANNTERMRIDSSGNLVVGTTSAQNTTSGRGNITLSGASEGAIFNWGIGSTNKSYIHQGTSNTTWYLNVSGGSIDIQAYSNGVRLSSGATSWSAISDERKKDIIEPIEDAISKVTTLRAVIGKYKTDEEGTRRSFLIAQDVQAVFPEAVDAQDSEQLGLRYTETIPLLVAAIKELKIELDAAKERISALEAGNVPT